MKKSLLFVALVSYASMVMPTASVFTDLKAQYLSNFDPSIEETNIDLASRNLN